MVLERIPHAVLARPLGRCCAPPAGEGGVGDASPFDLSFHPCPACKAVLARQRELRGGQGHRLGSALELASLSAKLIEIGAFRQLAHRVFLRAGARSQALKENGLRPHVNIWRWTAP